MAKNFYPLLAVAMFVLAALACNGDTEVTDAPAEVATKEPSPTPTIVSTNTPAPPIKLNGTGQTATNQITLPSPVSIAHFTHQGTSNFVVKVYQGDKEDLLINEIGIYNGSRPLVGDSVILDIDADGPWSVVISAITAMSSPAFSGIGDAVSGLFDTPASGAWEINHDGQSNFVVYLHCAGGSDLIQNEIGPVQGSRVVKFPSGPCFWEIQADGNWSLNPR